MEENNLAQKAAEMNGKENGPSIMTFALVWQRKWGPSLMLPDGDGYIVARASAPPGSKFEHAPTIAYYGDVRYAKPASRYSGACTHKL